jgi:hypothetical protein
MLQERMKAATMVADRLFTLEAALDVALSEAGAMVSDVSTARNIAKVSATVGHEAVEHLSETLLALTQARTRVMALHAHLDQTRAQLGLRNRVLAMGDLPKLIPPKKGALNDVEVVTDIRSLKRA